jgi:hypothetical protein
MITSILLSDTVDAAARTPSASHAASHALRTWILYKYIIYIYIYIHIAPHRLPRAPHLLKQSDIGDIIYVQIRSHPSSAEKSIKKSIGRR